VLSAANIAGISLCMKTVVGQPIESAANSGTIRTPHNLNIGVASDTEIVAEGVILLSNLLHGPVNAFLAKSF
jgi:hypothetical protein